MTHDCTQELMLPAVTDTSCEVFWCVTEVESEEICEYFQQARLWQPCFCEEWSSNKLVELEETYDRNDDHHNYDGGKGN